MRAVKRLSALNGLGAVEDYSITVTDEPDRALVGGYGIFVNTLRVVATDKDGYEAGEASGLYGDRWNVARYMEATEKYATRDNLKKSRSALPAGYLGFVGVAEAHARGGLGRALMAQWLKEATARCVGNVILEVFPTERYSPSPEALARFYGSLGFKRAPKMADDGMMMQASLKTARSCRRF